MISRPWQEWVAAWLTQGNVEAVPEALLMLGALLLTASFTVVQTATLWGTHWGDRHALAKSFWLSLLVHLALFCGWSTVLKVSPPARQVVDVPQPPEDVPIPIQQVLDGASPRDEFFDRLAKTFDELPTPDESATRQRTEVLTPPVEPELELELPEVSPDQLPPSMTDDSAAVAELVETSTSLPETNPEQPAVAPETPETPEITAAPTDAGLPPESLQEARSEATLMADAARAPLTAPSDASEELVTPAISTAEPGPAELGTSPDLAATIVPQSPSSVPLPSGEEATPAPQVDTAGPMVTRSTAPAVGPIVGEEAGVADGAPQATTGGVAATPGRFQRGRRTIGSADGSVTAPEMALPRAEATPDLGLAASTPLASLSPSDYGTPGDFNTPIPTPAPVAESDQVTVRRPSKAPTSYELRDPTKRTQNALQRGGTVQSERAVNRALEWLAKSQEPEGNWDSQKYGGGATEKDPSGVDRLGGGRDADAGVTGLSLLAFLGAGHSPHEGPYARNVARAAKWLIIHQRSDGYLGNEATYYDAMYCHAIATFALAETLAIHGESQETAGLQRTVSSAVRFIINMQNEDGGWRYRKGQQSDMSMFGWQLMALNSARNAGIEVPETVWASMIKFLKSRSLGDKGGLSAYRPGERPTPAMSAEALFCKQVIGISKTNPASVEAVAYLQENLPRQSRPDNYYWYYGTLALKHHGGDAWLAWNESLRDTLVATQHTDGPLAGTWDPLDPWGGIGGRLYSTALATMCLEVYYRYRFPGEAPTNAPPQ